MDEGYLQIKIRETNEILKKVEEEVKRLEVC